MKGLLSILAITLIFFGCSSGEPKMIRGKVVSHEITSDGFGNTCYHTIINCNDSITRDRGSLRFYGLKIGDSCTLEDLGEKRWYK